MAVQTREIKPLRVPDTDLPESGVIKDARRHRRRERTAAGLLFLALIGAALLYVSQGNGAQVSRAHSSAPTWMTGAPLSGSTHLRLLVSENGGPASIVDVGDRHVQAVPGLGLPRKHRLWSPMLWPLIKVPGGALGIVTRRSCNNCTGSETHFLISPSGVARRISSFRLAPDQSTTPVLGSNSSSWVLTHPRRGRCTLRVEPGSRPAVPAPCGDPVADTALGAASPAGLIISTSERMLLVNPRTGQVLARSPLNGQLDVVSSTSVLTSRGTGVLGPLTLINLRSGARTRLRWPSRLRFGYEALPEPHSSTVALEFADPAYDSTGTQAGDVWLLNTRTGSFTHVPGFPIFEYLKVSDIAWTTDRRLVVVAQGGGRTAIGVWRPGSRRLQVGTVPALTGYSQFVPFVR